MGVTKIRGEHRSTDCGWWREAPMPEEPGLIPRGLPWEMRQWAVKGRRPHPQCLSGLCWPPLSAACHAAWTWGDTLSCRKTVALAHGQFSLSLSLKRGSLSARMTRLRIYIEKQTGSRTGRRELLAVEVHQEWQGQLPNAMLSNERSEGGSGKPGIVVTHWPNAATSPGHCAARRCPLHSRPVSMRRPPIISITLGKSLTFLGLTSLLRLRSRSAFWDFFCSRDHFQRFAVS